MILKATLITLALSSAGLLASPVDKKEKFEQDRKAILAMAGQFEVSFTFEEKIALTKGYELKKPYSSKAHELVEIAEDTGKKITLQHLLVIEDFAGPSVIKHWAQIWTYEDPRTLTFTSNNTWEPVTHSIEKSAGTWTQLVTQIDDSPRYKAQGIWSHRGQSSTWTSHTSYRPLPRRDYTKRSDYDRLVVINQHIITPEGWVHQQNNRKQVLRSGKDHFLCIEQGLNRYTRVDSQESKPGFELARKEWAESEKFWKKVRHAWLDILEKADKPVSYAKKIEGKRLMSRMRKLSEKKTASRAEIDELIATFLR